MFKYILVVLYKDRLSQLTRGYICSSGDLSILQQCKYIDLARCLRYHIFFFFRQSCLNFIKKKGKKGYEEAEDKKSVRNVATTYRIPRSTVPGLEIYPNLIWVDTPL